MRNKNAITFYGATWCTDCRRARQYLDERGVLYEYKNIQEDSEALEEVAKLNKGLQSVPTIIFPDGKVLVEPSNEELQKALATNKNLIVSHKGEMK